MAQQTSTCKECGWRCSGCRDQGALHLHVEIENLKQRLLERERHIVTMETTFLAEADRFPNGEMAALTEELLTWQDKYSRLYESYKRVQKVNQNLEDKLLKIVDKCETEKNSLIREVSSLTQRLVDSRARANRLQSENERYRNDVNLAIQLLQCKPANFVSQKYDTLPSDLQQKVLSYMCGKRRTSDGSAVPIRLEMRTIKVPVATSPPAAMLYSVNRTPPDAEESCDESGENPKPAVDIVSAAIMAKVLAERERERLQVKHCETCRCLSSEAVTTDQATQTSVVTPTDGIDSSWTTIDWASQGLTRYVDTVATRSVSNNRLGIKTSSAPRTVKRDATSVVLSELSDSNSMTYSTQSDVGPSVDFKTISDESGFKNKPVTTSKNGSKSFNGGNTQQNNSDIYSSSGVFGNGGRITSFTENGVYNSGRLPTEEFLPNDAAYLKHISSDSDKPNHVSQNSKGSVHGIVDVEVSGDGRIETSTVRGRSSGENQNRVTVYHTKSSSEGSIMKIQNREGRSYLAEDPNANERSSGNWTRYPVKPTESGPSKLAASTVGGSVKTPRERSGLRLCSLRVHTGASNILLDNATAYKPVLYTSRHEGVSAAVLVHAPRRSTSSEEKSATESEL